MAEGQSERKKEKKHNIIQEVKTVNLSFMICLELCWVTLNFQLLGPIPEQLNQNFWEMT